jgi:hypothetical protein
MFWYLGESKKQKARRYLVFCAACDFFTSVGSCSMQAAFQSTESMNSRNSRRSAALASGIAGGAAGFEFTWGPACCARVLDAAAAIRNPGESNPIFRQEHAHYRYTFLATPRQLGFRKLRVARTETGGL